MSLLDVSLAHVRMTVGCGSRGEESQGLGAVAQGDGGP